MESTADGTQGATVKPKFIAQWMVLIAALGVSYIIVTRVIDAGKKIIYHSAPTTNEAVLAHCAQFIMLAEAKYADDWKFRLDPRDTVCADQIQQEWERQSAERKQAPVEEKRPTYVERQQNVNQVSEYPLDMNAARARNPETFCLNVISLAKTKYGAEWRSKVSPEESAGCEAAMQAAGQ